MTSILCCGFECGQLGSVGEHWSIFNGSPAISTSTVRSGQRSIRFNPAGTTGSIRSTSFTASDKWVVRFYVFFASLPTANYPICFTTGANHAVFFQSSDSKIYARNSLGTTGSTGVSVTTGQWYLIDFSVDASAAIALIDVKVNGTACGQATLGSLGTTTQISFGDTGTNTTDMFIDDVIISNTLADYPIGEGFVNHFVPTADGTHNVAGANDFERTLTGTDIINATTTAFDLVNDVPLESGASVDWINMIAPPGAGDYVECIFGPAPGISAPTAGPVAVEVIAGIHQAGTGAGNMEIRMNDNGTTNAMYSAAAAIGVTSVAYKRKHYATAIAGGGAWVIGGGGNGDFTDLRFQFGSPASLDVNPDQYLDCIMIEAAFAGTAATKFIRDIIGGMGIIPFKR